MQWLRISNYDYVPRSATWSSRPTPRLWPNLHFTVTLCMAPEKVIARSFSKIMAEFWFDLFLFVSFLHVRLKLVFVLLSRCLARIASRDEFVALHGESPITKIAGFQPERVLSQKILATCFFQPTNWQGFCFPSAPQHLGFHSVPKRILYNLSVSMSSISAYSVYHPWSIHLQLPHIPQNKLCIYNII